MSWILPPGSSLRFEGLPEPVRLRRALGRGSQGCVYEAETGQERVAIKWYWPHTLQADPFLEQRLSECIRITSPSDSFLWPIALLRLAGSSQASLHLPDPGFGYMMPLRPPDFVGVYEHVAGQVAISIPNLLKASFRLADAFHQLHLRGLCYKDISQGNLFLDPGSGRILVCDNDNVDINGRNLGNVIGTPGFMAPEILLRQQRPGTNSDLYSLAVLIFLLLTRSDPLRGRLEMAISCLNLPARRYLYGEKAVFIFDPDDAGNRPDSREHALAQRCWAIYPDGLKALFEQTFCRGRRQPALRALTGQWKQELALCLDHHQDCPVCGQENVAMEARGRCWDCGAPLPAPATLMLANGRVTVAQGNQLHPHHFDRFQVENIDHPVAVVERDPRRPGSHRLRNLSSRPWRISGGDGAAGHVDPGASCPIVPGLRLSADGGTIDITAAAG